jgi:hypothetical protein
MQTPIRKLKARLPYARDVGVLTLGAFVIGGCASMGFSVDRDKLINTASFDHNCPAEKIQILSEDDDGSSGTGRYLLKVCDQQKRYKRAGTVYYDAEKGSPLDS